MNILKNTSLLAYNTFGINAKASYLATYKSCEELRQLLHYEPFRQLPKLPVGCGSNLLFINDYEGVVFVSDIHFIRETEQQANDLLIEVGSGVIWDDFVAYCVKKGYYGAENLSLIPGTAGASAVQNIGAYGAEAKDLIDSVHCMDIASGQEYVFTNSELQYSYRSSRFKTEWKNRFIITSVVYRLHTEKKLNLTYKGLREAIEAQTDQTAGDLQAVRNAVIEIRRTKLPDPAVTGNAGSYFMNPIVDRALFEQLQSAYPAIPHYDLPDQQVKIPAAWLIEQCGWKGKSLGPAATHATQPLVLVNLGQATGQDIANLASQIIQDIQNKFGIALRPEVIYVK